MDDESCHPIRAAATMSDAEDDDAETCAGGEENSNNPDTSDTYSDRPDWAQSETTSTKASASSTSASSTATATARPTPCSGDATASDPVSGHVWAILDPCVAAGAARESAQKR